MFSGLMGETDCSFGVEELLQIKLRCRELRKEKEVLRESESQSFELIKRLELHVKSLSEAHNEDKKHIQALERELLNCSQEIDYLQDQLNTRNAEVYSMGEHVHELELQLVDMENVQVNIDKLSGELENSNSERLLLIQELQSREEELQDSALYIKKLEEMISSQTLDSECEIESMRLDIMALEQACFDNKKTAQEKTSMEELIEKLKVQICHMEQIIEGLESENKELRDKIVSSEMDSRLFMQKIEEWLDNKENSQIDILSYLSTLLRRSNKPKEMSNSMDAISPLFSKLAIKVTPESSIEEQMQSMSHQIRKYEVLVEQLKEELKAEKLKAKEEAEDLAQEMAEVRYQMTNLLEDECKRRASIEQASLHRIAELEEQLRREP